MKAAVYHRYGPPGVVRIADVPKPDAKTSEVLVKVRATTVTAGDSRLRSGRAVVTGVCSAANAQLVRSLGADRVVDYASENFAEGDDTYDVILDAVGN
jgi:NADPH:quinone reductase-like Zn-dependent oxidoreductase